MDFSCLLPSYSEISNCSPMKIRISGSTFRVTIPPMTTATYAVVWQPLKALIKSMLSITDLFQTNQSIGAVLPLAGFRK